MTKVFPASLSFQSTIRLIPSISLNFKSFFCSWIGLPSHSLACSKAHRFAQPILETLRISSSPVLRNLVPIPWMSEASQQSNENPKQLACDESNSPFPPLRIRSFFWGGMLAVALSKTTSKMQRTDCKPWDAPERLSGAQVIVCKLHGSCKKEYSVAALRAGSQWQKLKTAVLLTHCLYCMTYHYKKTRRVIWIKSWKQKGTKQDAAAEQ